MGRRRQPLLTGSGGRSRQRYNLTREGQVLIPGVPALGDYPAGWTVSSTGAAGAKVLTGPEGQVGLDYTLGSGVGKSVSVFGAQDARLIEEAARAGTPIDITEYIKDTWNTQQASAKGIPGIAQWPPKLTGVHLAVADFRLS